MGQIHRHGKNKFKHSTHMLCALSVLVLDKREGHPHPSPRAVRRRKKEEGGGKREEGTVCVSVCACVCVCACVDACVSVCVRVRCA